MAHKHSKDNFAQFYFLCIPALLSGVTISVSMLAVHWVFQNISGKTSLVSFDLALTTLGVILFAPLSGRVCRRFQIKNILICIYVLVLLIYGLLWLLEGYIAQNNLIVYIAIILLFSLFIDVVKQLEILARTSYIKYNFFEQHFRKGNSLLEILRQGITFVGGGAGYLLLQDKALDKVLLFGLFAFLAALLCSLRIRPGVMPELAAKQRGLGASECLNYVRSHPQEFGLFLAAIVPNLSVLILNTLNPKLVEVAHMGKTGFALLSIPYGLGAIAACSPYYSAFMGRFYPKFRDSLPHCYALNTLGFVSAMAMVYFYTVSYVVYIVIFLIAFFHVSVRITRVSDLMRRCSAENVSQILAFDRVFLSVVSIILFMLLGYISDFFSFWNAWFFVVALNIVVLLGYLAARTVCSNWGKN